MPTVKQLSFAPTNKLTAAMLAGAAYEFVQPAVTRGVEFSGEVLGIAWTLGSNGDMLLQFGAMAIVGYFVQDRPNVTLAPSIEPTP
jgi:hypothetical protein